MKIGEQVHRTLVRLELVYEVDTRGVQTAHRKRAGRRNVNAAMNVRS